jgi:tetratricopeptide (TPR) repeat protein
MALLRRALALDPKAADARRLLAHTLAEAGRFDEAEALLMETLARDPRAAFEYYELTKTRKMTPADRPILQRMSALLEAGGISQYDRMVLHFGLGKAHDDLREFEAAIGHFDAANRMRSANAPLDRRRVSEIVDRNIELFPAGANTFDASLGVDDERAVFILGLPRSGTTLVEQILSSHPAVAAGGELGFWGEHGWPLLLPGAKPLSRDVLHDLAGRFQALLRGISADATRVTDKNLFNYLNIGVLRLAFPRAFIIHCRRHPVDNCLSMYMTFLAARDTYYMGNREDLVFYHGEYARLMRHWREVLPPGRFLEVDYEALTGDRESQTRRLISFCELDWHDACLQPERNARAITTASVWQARQPVYRTSVARWRNYLPWLGPLAELLQEAERGG